MTAQVEQIKERVSSQETRLLEFVARLRSDFSGRSAIHCHFSRLDPRNRKAHHLRRVTKLFDPLVQRDEASCFLLRNADLVVVFATAGSAEVSRAILQIQDQFTDDPLVRNDRDGSDVLYTWYDLEQDFDAFVHMAQARHEVSVSPVSGPNSVFRDMPANNALQPTEPLDARYLGQLEAVLASTDVTPFLRRQAICALTSKGVPRPVFQELYVSVSALQRQMMPNVDLSANRWLFQHLTGLLDRRVLSVLPDLSANGPLTTSINLNVPTVLSEAFLTFDTRLRSKTEKKLIIEVQPFDIFADMANFINARDLAAARGHKFCLDGQSHATFPMLNKNDFGVAFQKLSWSPDLEYETQPKFLKRLGDAVISAGRARVILTRCDDKRAVEFGQSMGIAMFQGRYVDQLLS